MTTWQAGIGGWETVIILRMSRGTNGEGHEAKECYTQCDKDVKREHMRNFLLKKHPSAPA
jgi:hypothetical protein